MIGRPLIALFRVFYTYANELSDGPIIVEYGSALADELEVAPNEPEPTSDGDEEKIKRKRPRP